MTRFCFQAIGRIHSCFTEKFGIPRQPRLVPEAEAIVEIAAPFHQKEAFRGLDRFSHIWIIFVFHKCYEQQWKATVRPPRLGGNQRVGVFASRSGFRPNAIGQSAVELIEVSPQKNSLSLKVTGADLLDGTPVLDIKPYLGYADSIPQAISGYAATSPAPHFSVRFSIIAEQACTMLDPVRYHNAKQLIIAILSQDPRPAYKKDDASHIYGMRLWDLNIRFRYDDEVIEVVDITLID